MDYKRIENLENLVQAYDDAMFITNLYRDIERWNNAHFADFGGEIEAIGKITQETAKKPYTALTQEMGTLKYSLICKEALDLIWAEIGPYETKLPNDIRRRLHQLYNFDDSE